MRIALETRQPLTSLLEAEDAEIATWIELLDQQAEQRRR